MNAVLLIVSVDVNIPPCSQRWLASYSDGAYPALKGEVLRLFIA